MKLLVALTTLAVLVPLHTTTPAASPFIGNGAPWANALGPNTPAYAQDVAAQGAETPEIVAITEASAVIELDQATIFIDPVGAQSQYARYGSPDIVVLTSVEPSHLSIDTMIGMLRRNTIVLAPQAVIDQLPLMISNNTFAPFDAGTAQDALGVRFTAFPSAANTPRDAQVYPRDQGDIRVLMEADGYRVLF